MTEALRRLGRGLLRPVNTSAVLILGVYTILWGFWIGNPFWSVFARADLYDAMAQAGGEPVWGVFAFIVGVITCYGAVKGKPPYAFWGAGASAIHWMVIAIFYFAGDWQNTGGITSLTFAVYAAYIYANVKVNYEHNDLDVDLAR